MGPAWVGPGVAPARDRLGARLLLGPQGAAPGPALQPLPRKAPLVPRHAAAYGYVLTSSSCLCRPAQKNYFFESANY